jgi:hypothetical protein
MLEREMSGGHHLLFQKAGKEKGERRVNDIPFASSLSKEALGVHPASSGRRAQYHPHGLCEDDMFGSGGGRTGIHFSGERKGERRERRKQRCFFLSPL